MRVQCIFTCYNRKEKSYRCIKSLANGNQNIFFDFIVVDDNSTDGTREMLCELRQKEGINVRVVKGPGNLYYSQGMRLGMKFALQTQKDYDYLLMVNDDVLFIEHSIEGMIKESVEKNNAVIVGATKDSNGNLSYSAIKYVTGYRYRQLSINEYKVKADTFNANCVLIPYFIFLDCGPLDEKYIHSLGDFDYGLEIRKRGYDIFVSKDYCGICNKNPTKNSWLDPNLSIKKRLQLKESVKGAPMRQWYYFLKKNFGIKSAIIGSLTPYIRIILKR